MSGYGIAMIVGSLLALTGGALTAILLPTQGEGAVELAPEPAASAA
jgi:hypothetical protein